MLHRPVVDVEEGDGVLAVLPVSSAWLGVAHGVLPTAAAPAALVVGFRKEKQGGEKGDLGGEKDLAAAAGRKEEEVRVQRGARRRIYGGAEKVGRGPTRWWSSCSSALLSA